jgi:hypothetical protein
VVSPGPPELHADSTTGSASRSRPTTSEAVNSAPDALGELAGAAVTIAGWLRQRSSGDADIARSQPDRCRGDPDTGADRQCATVQYRHARPAIHCAAHGQVRTILQREARCSEAVHCADLIGRHVGRSRQDTRDWRALWHRVRDRRHRRRSLRGGRHARSDRNQRQCDEGESYRPCGCHCFPAAIIADFPQVRVFTLCPARPQRLAPSTAR